MEKKIVTRRVGRIDPENIEDYIAEDGYQALAKALTWSAPKFMPRWKKPACKDAAARASLTGMKWRFVAGTKSPKKYVVCNADESEPGTFKDRIIQEGDPHSILEAMAIAAYCVGADEGYIYVRGEYQLAQRRLEKAILQAREFGLLGKNILDSGFNFDVHVHSGAGAYVCGEETALLESIEGKRGEPRARPPYPTTHGLWGKPTLVNNVETLANVPPILLNGAGVYTPRLARHPPARAQVLHHFGQRQLSRSHRSSNGHHPARGHQHLRAGDEERRVLQDGADRRFERLDYPGQFAGYADGLRVLQESRGFARFGRPCSSAMRATVCWSRGDNADEVLPVRVVRQMHALPRRHRTRSADFANDCPRRRQTGRPGYAGRDCPGDGIRLQLRLGADGERSHPRYAQILPR